MALGETLIAGAAAVTCVALFARLLLRPSRRARVDRAVIRAFERLRAATRRLAGRRASSKAAARAAHEAIRRARGTVERDGNVYRPRDFRRPRKPH